MAWHVWQGVILGSASSGRPLGGIGGMQQVIKSVPKLEGDPLLDGLFR